MLRPHLDYCMQCCSSTKREGKVMGEQAGTELPDGFKLQHWDKGSVVKVCGHSIVSKLVRKK